MSEKLDDSPSSDSPKRPTRPRRHSSLRQPTSQNPLLTVGDGRGGGAIAGEAASGSTSPVVEKGGNGLGDLSATSDEGFLPPPAVAFIPPDPASKLRVQWQKFLRRIGNGSAPSESLGDPTTTTESDGGSSFGVNRRQGLGLNGEKKDDDEEEVDEVVVEQTTDYHCWKKTTIPSNSASARAGGTGTTPGTGTGPIGTMPSDASSLRQTAYEANGIIEATIGFVRYRTWPIVSRFFSPTYHDPAVEEAFQKEQWYNQKSLAVFGSFYLILNWVLTISLLPHPWSVWNKVQNYGLGPLLSVPLIVFAAFDAPRRQTWCWQLIVFASIWITAVANPIDMYNCGYYTNNAHCGNKDYMATFYYAMSGPVIGLFALGMKRIFHVLYCLSWLILVCVTIVPQRPAFVRNVVNLILFQGFICFIHYIREMSDRRMYTMRAELKISFKAKQRAQINERKMMDAKRRFSSYIFHEVRVPLNTALLAVQNLSGLNVFDKNGEHGVEFEALEGSLHMMSQVLNDVLDFSRMERGGFSSVSRPFSPLACMRSIFVPLRLDAAARGLTLETYLDPRIDQLAVQAAYPDEDIGVVQVGEGKVMGDEMRLRQIIGNLVSNACKFTKAGGKISIRVTLIYPLEEDQHQHDSPQTSPSSSEVVDGVKHSDETEKVYSPRLSAGRLQAHEAKTSPQPKEMMVIQFEVEDTGVGIKKSDMAENRLFSPYVQTAAGREQGGKGTGLGLSLVRQIVMLSGGRLGVRSKYGEGTSMIVQLPFAIGKETREGADGEIQHRRKDTGGSTMVDKDAFKDSIYSPITPMSDGSAASDYRFVASLRKRSSDPTLDSIDETNSSPWTRPRDSSISTQLSVPLAYRFSSPPTSPGIASAGPPSPSVFVHSATPPVAPCVTAEASQPYSPLTPSPPAFNHPFLRPENRSHVSSASAPAEVTLPGAVSPSSSPTVTPTSSTSPPLPSTALVAAPKTNAGPALNFPDGPLRVLVVDDDALTRKLMTRMLTRLGMNVDTAEDGKMALDKILAPPLAPSVADDGAALTETLRDDVDAAEKGLAVNVPSKIAKRVTMDPTAGIHAYKHYDIIFLDNWMPKKTGVEVVAKLRSLARDDLVIGVTANALHSDQEQYLEAGASSILTKPVKEADLKKYLGVADKRRAEAKNPALRRQRAAMEILAGPSFPTPPSIHSDEE
ncbi:hypothetical protein JCM8547_000535 [Rhodosporidiobolus lusitaniae]